MGWFDRDLGEIDKTQLTGVPADTTGDGVSSFKMTLV
jgi:hypothetical protein